MVNQRSSFIAIPDKQDFAVMVPSTQDRPVQALCNLPCGQPCVCSCHVSENGVEVQNPYRF